MAVALNGGHVVGDEDDRAASSRSSREDAAALVLEGGVADREHLVDQQHVGVGLDHQREGEPDPHSRGVVLQLEVGELLELGELEHGVEPAAASRRERPIITPFRTTFSRAVNSR